MHVAHETIHFRKGLILFAFARMHSELFKHRSDILISWPLEHLRKVIDGCLGCGAARALLISNLVQDKVEDLLEFGQSVGMADLHTEEEFGHVDQGDLYVGHHRHHEDLVDLEERRSGLRREERLNSFLLYKLPIFSAFFRREIIISRR